MDFIINMVPFSSVYEEDRLKDILEKIIEEEDLPKYEVFTNEPPTKKKKRLEKVNIYIYCFKWFLAQNSQTTNFCNFKNCFL